MSGNTRKNQVTRLVTLRHRSTMSGALVPVEEVARLAGHASSRTTEVVYRRELRPVLTTGAEAMDRLFKAGTSQ
jgi:hypothetical protein